MYGYDINKIDCRKHGICEYNDIILNKLKIGRHFVKNQDGGHYRTFFAWH